MLEGRSRDAWRHTSALMAAAAGGSPQDFDPWGRHDEREYMADPANAEAEAASAAAVAELAAKFRAAAETG